MSFKFTNTGLQTQSFEEIFNEIADEYRAIYGQDINIAQDAPDGQRVGISATASLDMQAFAAWLYNSLDPDLASGVALNRIIKLVGITRRPATQSVWDLQVASSTAITLPAGYTVEDDLGQEWSINSPMSLPAGTNTVTFRALEFGAVEGVSGAVIEQSTIVVGVTSIVASVDSAVGVDEETDEQLRVRRNRSLENPALSTIGGLFAKLANTPGVTDIRVYENNTDTTDSDGIPAHYTYSVVEGGEIGDIVETIVKNKTAGAGTLGSVSGNYIETLTRPDGSTFTITHTMQFDRPLFVSVYITVTATRRDPAIPIDAVLIAQKIADSVLYIGDNLLASSLYAKAYQAGSDYYLTDLLISDDNAVFTDERLISAINEKYVISVSNITVTEVI